MTTLSSKRDSMDATTSDLSNKLESTTLSTASPTPKRSPLTLTSLPTSIRNRIYSHLLDTELVNLSQPNVSYTHTLTSSLLTFTPSRPPFPTTTSLFTLNRHLSRETLHYFYSTNLFIRLELYTADARHAKTMLTDSGILFVPSCPPTSATRHALDLTLVEKNSSQKRAEVMFPAQYLPRLINFWDQAKKATKSWASNHSLFVKVLNTYGFGLARFQGDVLELLRLVNGFGAVTIEEGEAGRLLPGYKEGLHESLTVGEVTAEGVKGVVEGAVERAEEALGRGEHELSAQLAQSGVVTLTYAYLTRPETLHMQADVFHKAIQRLRWRCELITAKALFGQHEEVTSSKGDWVSSTSAAVDVSKRQEVARDMLAAETAASRALSLATDSPSPNSNPWFQSLPAELIPPNKREWFTDEERGESWYVCGIVHTAVGEPLFAAGDLERACGLNPNGKGFEDAFQRAREGIDWNIKPGTGLKKVARLARQ
ncbi:hypothetical protein BU24DRAFT_387891 [Aaosphaeria arxii CBS 175.79]|uniref:Uncharacterized protein n=1 Tax=Aaosphaeria arxii CBS 175.79 TaxID=1450172 RepID=A0A6A5XVL1_9PLEO|nr:uncharacterized protein BU24DRAFT_387891 [Aaosphaeria arxii CBS 175.79]KAF2016989.1 hypothetical protein BU24DRAFT_387891 [Aaosphaeria arxii CBS 175.79]